MAGIILEMWVRWTLMVSIPLREGLRLGFVFHLKGGFRKGFYSMTGRIKTKGSIYSITGRIKEEGSISLRDGLR